MPHDASCLRRPLLHLLYPLAGAEAPPPYACSLHPPPPLHCRRRPWPRSAHRAPCCASATPSWRGATAPGAQPARCALPANGVEFGSFVRALPANCLGQLWGRAVLARQALCVGDCCGSTRPLYIGPKQVCCHGWEAPLHLSWPCIRQAPRPCGPLAHPRPPQQVPVDVAFLVVAALSQVGAVAQLQSGTRCAGLQGCGHGRSPRPARLFRLTYPLDHQLLLLPRAAGRLRTMKEARKKPRHLLVPLPSCRAPGSSAGRAMPPGWVPPWWRSWPLMWPPCR